MEIINSTKHIQALPVAQKRPHALESSMRTDLQRQNRPALSEKSSRSSVKPTKHFGHYEKGSFVDTYV
jgi:hypothetical protein